jgi:uncharacterized membrane protein
VPRELIVVLLAASPILELRGAMPVGKILGLPIEAIFFWSILGTILPVSFILKFLDPVSKFLMKHSKWFNRFLTKIFEKTRAKHNKRFEEVGSVLLILFSAIPLPGFGAWTGALIAYLFDIPYWKAVGLIFLGVIAMALIVGLTIESVTQMPAILRYFWK